MKEKAFEVLKIFENNGYIAYIVGGYVRDYLIGKKTLDIDICTNATPKDIVELFDQVQVSDFSYGSVSIIYKKVKFDVTTFRKDIKYEDNRKPIKIKYISNLKHDLLRRDFTINTICMNSNGEIIDLLNGKKDIENKLIKTVSNPRTKIKEDSLRILRAIRFATILDFDIEPKTKKYIIKYGKNLEKLSGSRKKEELIKIFSSVNKEKGRQLLIELKLDKYLKLDNLSNIVLCDDIIGIWSQLDVTNIYPFTKLEMEYISKIKELLNYKEIDEYTLYKYGLYLSTVVYDIKNKDKKILNKMYRELPIYNAKEIEITPIEIANILERKPGSYLKNVISDLERQIVYGKVNNNKLDIEKYILENQENILE